METLQQTAARLRREWAAEQANDETNEDSNE